MVFSVSITNSVPEFHDVTREQFEQEIAPAGKPAIFRQLVKDWPVLEAANRSTGELAQYLKGFDRGGQVSLYFGPHEMQGRYFYNDGLTGFNFEQGVSTLSNIIDQLVKFIDHPKAAALYAGSTPAPDALPGFAIANPNPLLEPSIMPRIWLGNSSRVAAHYDASRNIACNVAGKRRFTIFPPEQISNLYLGPLEYTMAGPPASMVDFHDPDYDRFPRFRDAEAAGMIAELEPGDAVYVPSLWWHHVEAEGPFNLLVNYWWTPAKSGMEFESVMLAMLAIRDQPPTEREAWRSFFEHFVFSDSAPDVAAHLPQQWQTVTGPASSERNKMVLDFVLSQLAQKTR
jgi:hypothetical protein